MISTKQKIVLGVLVALLTAAALATLYVVQRKSIDESTKNIFAGAEDTITYTDVNGAEMSLEDYLGQVLVVTSWASWSPFTESDLTSLNLMAADYPDEEVTFMAINRKETKDQAARLLATLPSFPELKIVIDTQDHFYHSVAGYAMPETIVFDEQGAIILHVRGALDAVAVRSAIDAALAAE